MDLYIGLGVIADLFIILPKPTYTLYPIPSYTYLYVLIPTYTYLYRHGSLYWFGGYLVHLMGSTA